MTLTADEQVRLANEAFYAAFASGEVAAMDRVWAKKAACACLHPGARPLFGRDDILRSWRQILADQGAVGLKCRTPHVLVTDNMALVICFETLGWNTLAATNGFVLEDGEWRMVLHQSGPCPSVPTPKGGINESPQIH